MRSEDFSFSFAKNVREFVVLGRNIGKVRNFCKFCEVSLNVQRVKTEFKIARVWKFSYIYKNAAVPMIAMLSCLELDIEVLDTGIKTMKSNNCRELLKDDRDANGMLAII